MAIAEKEGTRDALVDTCELTTEIVLDTRKDDENYSKESVERNSYQVESFFIMELFILGEITMTSPEVF